MSDSTTDMSTVITGDETADYAFDFTAYYEPEYLATEILPNLILGGECNVEKYENNESVVTINCAREVKPTSIYKFCFYDRENKREFNKDIEEAVDLIHKSITEGKTVFVHCRMGHSRSAFVVTYYLMKYQNLDFDKAYEFVKEKRPLVDIHNWFIKWVKSTDKDKLYYLPDDHGKNDFDPY